MKRSRTKTKPKAEPKKKGPQSNYSPSFIARAGAVIRLGGTNQDVADALGFSKSVVEKWLREYPDFREALKETKEQADRAVQVALYKRAIGYSVTDTDIRTVSIGDGCSKIVQTPFVKHYPPDATSCIFWLKNRQPDKWRERQEVTGPNGKALGENAPFDPSKLSVPELLALKGMLDKAKPTATDAAA